MGEKIPKPPIEFDNNCPSCTPALWANGETPRYIYSMFWGIDSCGVSPNNPPNNVIFRMEQTVGDNCTWRLDGSIWKPDLRVADGFPPFSKLRLLDSGGFSFFTGQSFQCRPEYWRYTNMQAACIFAYAGSKGYGTTWWNDDVTDLINEFGLDTNGKLFYELFIQLGVFEVHKFTNLYQRTNIKFKHV